MYKIYVKLRKHLLKIIGAWSSFTFALILEYINNPMDDFIAAFTDSKKIANIVLWIFTGVVIICAGLCFLSGKMIENQNPNKLFLKLMDEKTFEWLRSENTHQIDFSWGYNKNIHRCKNPLGWKPEEFWISDYDSAEYKFPKNPPKTMFEYSEKEYREFCNTEKIRNCILNHNDMERFAVHEITPNFNDKEKRVQLVIKKTRWSALQFHWDYMRVLNEKNRSIINEKKNIESIKSKYEDAFQNKENNIFELNSFCLHLILEDKNGNAVLSRVSSSKSNDYPTTWAATLGEQLSLADFYDESSGNRYPDFIVRWTKRALEEELGISEHDLTETSNELEEFVNMDSLRILSIDMEGDIYNIAITAVVKLNMSVDQLKTRKGIVIHSEEITELQACDLKTIKEILLGYPENSSEYHPSTYLRLLMFYLYKCGIKDTVEQISKKTKKLRGQTP